MKLCQSFGQVKLGICVLMQHGDTQKDVVKTLLNVNSMLFKPCMHMYLLHIIAMASLLLHFILLVYVNLLSPSRKLLVI